MLDRIELEKALITHELLKAREGLVPKKITMTTKAGKKVETTRMVRPEGAKLGDKRVSPASKSRAKEESAAVVQDYQDYQDSSDEPEDAIDIGNKLAKVALKHHGPKAAAEVKQAFSDLSEAHREKIVIDEDDLEDDPDDPEAEEDYWKATMAVDDVVDRYFIGASLNVKEAQKAHQKAKSSFDKLRSKLATEYYSSEDGWILTPVERAKLNVYRNKAEHAREDYADAQGFRWNPHKGWERHEGVPKSRKLVGLD